MFLGIMEPRTENKNSSLVKTVMIIWAQICMKLPKNNLQNSDLKGVKFCVTQFGRDLHMFLDIIELRIEEEEKLS